MEEYSLELTSSRPSILVNASFPLLMNTLNILPHTEVIKIISVVFMI